MYQILNSIFGRELNENYRTNTKSNLAGTVADIGNYLDARKNYKMNEARKQKYLNKDGFDEVSPMSNGAIGATGDGIYGVNTMLPQANGGGIGVDANGVYGIGGGGQSMFRGGNFDWGNTQMPSGNSVMDVWNKEQPKTMFQGNAPQNPQGGGGNFTSILGNNTGIFGKDLNPYQPSNSSNNLAQSIEGQNNASANDLSRYLGDEYNRGRWIHQDYVDRGIDDPVISMLRYDTKIAPLVQRAREDRVKDLFMRSNNPNLSDEERMEARLQLSGELQDPEFVDKMEYNKWKRQKERDEWDLDRISKGIKNQAAQESLENNRILSDLASAFPDGQVYKVNMGEGYEDEGLRQTNPELVQGLDILNTYARNRYGKDFTVTGGWRSKENNAKNNGHPNSHHLYGEAVDLVDSGLTPEQRDDIVRFAKAIGFNSVLYHDAGSGNHLHLALEKGTHLKGLNIGKGKTLTVNQMLGQTTTKNGKTVKDDGSLNLSYDYEQTLNSMIRKFSSAPDSADGMVGLAKTLAPLYADIEKQSNSETAKKKIHNYVKKIANEGAKKGEEINESYISTVVANTVAQAKNGNSTDKSGEKKEETKNGLIDKSKTVSGQTREGGTPPSSSTETNYKGGNVDIDDDEMNYGEEGGGYSLHNANGDFRVNDSMGRAILANIMKNKQIEDAVNSGRYGVTPWGGTYNIRDTERELRERAMGNG